MKKITTLIIGIIVSIPLFSQKDSLPEFEISTIGSGSILGSALIDYNNDGLTDLFLSNRTGTNSLYKNDGNFVFTEVTTGEIVTDNHPSCGFSWGDFDNDGDLDLYISNGDFSISSVNCLYINNGDSTFTKDTSHILVQDTLSTFDCAWFDYNNDSHLDLYILNNNQRNQLFEGLGNGDFVEIFTGELPNLSTSGLSVHLGDYNNDSYVDLYVAKKYIGPSFLYLNKGDGTYSMERDNIIMHYKGAGTGGSWGDYNNDGFIDFIALSDAPSLGFKNNLYSNNKDGSFTIKASSPITSTNSNSYGSSWVDIDNDGDLDLYISNSNQINWFYQNKGNGLLEEITNINFINFSGDEVSLIWEDIDNDGDMDCFMGTYSNVPNYLIKNAGNNNNWVKFRLYGNCSNRNALGVKVRIKATVFGSSYWQMRELSSKSGNRVQASHTLHFGLGDASNIDSTIIEWPSGRKTVLTDLNVNTKHVFEEIVSSSFNLINSNPEDITLCKNENARFECKSIILNKNVYWQYFENDNWFEINNSQFDYSILIDETDKTKSILSINNVQTSYNNSKFRCIVEDKCNMFQSISDEANIIISNCYEFSGEVYAGNSLLEKGIVELYEQSDSSFSKPSYFVEVINGKFFLPKIKDSWYHFLVKPYGPEKELYYPTYYYKTIYQENSIPKHINKDVVKEFFYLMERSCSPATISSYSLLDNTNNDFYSQIISNGNFGYSMDTLGDLNNDGFMDIVVGAPHNSISCTSCGSVFILFLDEDLDIISYKNLTKGEDLPSLDIKDNDYFGCDVVNLGDMDNDGVTDILASAYGCDDGMGGNSMLGAFYIIYLNTDGTAKDFQKVSATSGNLGLNLVQYCRFGNRVLNIGDINNDSVTDLLISQVYPKDLHIVYLNIDGTVKSTKTIVPGNGNFKEEFDNSSMFGVSMKFIGDLDGDGNKEIAISDPSDDMDFTDAGAIYILFPDNELDIKKYTKISSSSFFNSSISSGDYFGYSLYYLGDYFNSGNCCLAVASYKSDMFGFNKGAIYLLDIDKEGKLNDYMVVQSQNMEFENNLLENYSNGVDILSFNNKNEKILLSSIFEDNKVGKIYKHRLCNDGHPIDFLSISGYVNGDGLPIYSGKVKLYLTSNPDEPKYEVDITNGRFVFNNIEPGQYYLCAEPTGFYSNYYSETYYVQTDINSEALIMNINSSNANITINLLTATDIETEEISSDNEIKIFPNPATSELNIQNILNIKNITITNIIGMEVKQYDNKYSFSCSFDISELKTGIYILVFEDNEGKRSIKKFCKEY